jgi:hypothetical protein
VVNITPRLLYPPVPLEYEYRWASKPPWTVLGEEQFFYPDRDKRCFLFQILFRAALSLVGREKRFSLLVTNTIDNFQHTNEFGRAKYVLEG